MNDAATEGPYDGRFAEIVVYERGLTAAEIEDVECYLLFKWKPASAPSSCSIVVSANKTVEVFSAVPATGFALPGSDVIYSIEVTHEIGPDLDDGSIFIVDTLPLETIFFSGDIDGPGPTLNFASNVAFSNVTAKPSTIADCGYVPISGYDPAVRHVCINPSGVFLTGSPDIAFTVAFRARIQ